MYIFPSEFDYYKDLRIQIKNERLYSQHGVLLYRHFKIFINLLNKYSFEFKLF